ncbi:MAG TPA: PD-(D/E)XK nuclease family protein [Candidatus Obscuribacterales bacterium]
MSLDIIFGWHLDGLSYPETTSGRLYEVGGLILGPAGLSQQLALRLNLAVPFAPQAVRIAKYLRALQECDDEKQFYSASFKLDPWSTASCLLVMRDQLIAAGWDGKRAADGSPKLRSFGRVERIAYPVRSPAETLRAILYKVREERTHRYPIKSIKLVTPPDLLPAAWQEILAQLSHGLDVDQIPLRNEFDESSDLGSIQAFLAAGKKSPLNNDGSFTLLEADDEYQLSEVVAAWLSAKTPNLDAVVILRNGPTQILDAHCARLGLSRLGRHDKSRWRSALQLLPLMLETCWLPANPYRTLELISLPGGPVPRKLSYHFARALRTEPGFGGDCWSSAWGAAESELRSDFSAESDDPLDIEGRIKSTLENLRFWLEPVRSDPASGMSCDQVVKVCRRVMQWAGSNLANPEASEMFAHAMKAAQELAETISACGLKTVTKIQLDRMLDAVAGEGILPENWHAEDAEWSLLDHPGQLWSGAKSLLWWGFTHSKIALERFDPWTAMELKMLADAGIELERPSKVAVREAYAWRQALLNVEREVLLCHSRMSKGQTSNIHPLWHEIEDLVYGLNGGVIEQAHRVLSCPRSKIGHSVLPLSEVETRSPPGAHRYWSAPMDSINERSEESVSSVRLLFGCPLAWTLRYHAQLHPGTLLLVPDGEPLIGDIAHKVFKRLMEMPAHEISDETVAMIFDELIASVGLPLLARGRDVERESAKGFIVESAKTFLQFLRDEQLIVDACEVRKERAFRDSTFVGNIDIVLRTKDGQRLVVDHKWTKRPKYRVEEIRKSQHLQLVAYNWLDALESEARGAAGYYLLRQRRLVHCGDYALRVGQRIDSAPLEQMWERIEQEYDKALAALKKGIIRAAGVPEGDEFTEEKQPFSIEAPCKVCEYGNLCGVRALRNG